MTPPRLRYTIDSNPDPLPAGEVAATLTLTAGLPSRNQYADLTRLTLTLPVGKEEKELVITPDRIAKTAPQGWTVTHSHPDSATFMITYEPEGDDPVTVDKDITFTLYPLDISPASGTCTLHITETSIDSDGNPTDATENIKVTKFRKDFRVGQFGPTEQVVPYGGSTELTWDITGATSFKIEWWEHVLQHKREQDLAGGVRTWTTPPLTSTTPLTLTAYAKDDQGGTLTHRMAAIVAVRSGDLEAGDLTVNGTVEAIREETPWKDQPKHKVALGDKPAGETRKITSCSLTAATDGLLCIQPVAATTSGNVLALHIPRAGKPAQKEAQFVLPLMTPMTIPLRRGASLVAERAHAQKKAVFEYYWFPLGRAGELTRTYTYEA
ncbi:hypothetical protein ABZ419_02320 [Streptomyces cinnamoneus]|uniref:hypothetical protein n=1 Tax=Streptomyces cinnamoneus TaxID=53446 RepID=UPI0033C25BA3